MNPDKPHEGVARALLLDVLDKTGLTRKELAERSGRHPSELTRLTQPQSNPTFGTLASLLWHVGMRLVIESRPVAGEPGSWLPQTPCVIETDAEHDLLLGA